MSKASNPHDLNEKLAARASHWDRTSERIQNEIDSLHKWILASCLTVNAGAIAFIFTMDSLDPRAKFWASVWFLSGICSAIGYAMAYNQILSRAQSIVAVVARTFLNVAEGISEMPDEDELLKPLGRLQRIARAIDWAHFLSLGCFVVGSIIVGYDFNDR